MEVPSLVELLLLHELSLHCSHRGKDLKSLVHRHRCGGDCEGGRRHGRQELLRAWSNEQDRADSPSKGGEGETAREMPALSFCGAGPFKGFWRM